MSKGTIVFSNTLVVSIHLLQGPEVTGTRDFGTQTGCLRPLLLQDPEKKEVEPRDPGGVRVLLISPSPQYVSTRVKT